MVRQNPLQGLLKYMVGPIPRVFDLLDLGWGPRICFFVKFPGHNVIAVFKTALWETLMYWKECLIQKSVNLGPRKPWSYDWVLSTNPGSLDKSLGLSFLIPKRRVMTPALGDLVYFESRTWESTGKQLVLLEQLALSNRGTQKPEFCCCVRQQKWNVKMEGFEGILPFCDLSLKKSNTLL